MSKHVEYQICNFCVMDTTAKEITFDEFGECNYCLEFKKKLSTRGFGGNAQKLNGYTLKELHKRISRDGSGKPYDCIVGVSGGIDSSFVLLKAVEAGLRPLAVHMDNGWNSDLSVTNISNLIERLDVDLYSYVINWDEYRNLMKAFFSSDVIDVELLYDNALHSVCYDQARRYGLKYILSGSNQSTEGLQMPLAWSWESKWDGANIRAIAKKFDVKIVTFPIFTTLKWLIYTYVFKIQWVPYLDYYNYLKEPALNELESKMGYRRYPYKHYENVFTRFYQGHILPVKFNVDKRRVHLSTLIVTGQMTREDAMSDLQGIPYGSESELEKDKEFFLKKMNWDYQALQTYLKRPEISHAHYGTDMARRFILKSMKFYRKFVKTNQ